MKASVVGASAGVGRAIAEQLASGGATLLLVASDERDLAAVRSDLLLMNGMSEGISIKTLDLAQACPCAAADAIREELGRADALFFVAGLGDVADIGALEPSTAERILRVNFTAPVLMINEIIRTGALAPGGTIVVLSSVATARPRGRNVAYGAAKRGLEQYVAALRMSSIGRQYKMIVYRLGYVDTGMMHGRAPLLPKASAEAVARRIVAGLAGRSTVRYVPAWWRLVALIMEITPAAVIRWLNI